MEPKRLDQLSPQMRARVLELEELLIEKMGWSKDVRVELETRWGVSDRRVYAVRETLWAVRATELAEERERTRQEFLSRLKAVTTRATQSQDWRAASSLLQIEARIQGLYEPPPQREPVPDEQLSRDEAVAVLAAMPQALLREALERQGG